MIEITFIQLTALLVSSFPSDTTTNAVFLDFLLKGSRIKVQQSDGSDGLGGSALFVTGGLAPQDPV